MVIDWRPEARQALWQILTYIGDHDLDAAERLYSAIEAAVEPLSEHPYLHRPGRVPGTREVVVHPNYIVVYRVAIDRVDIVDVLHARREYP